MSTNTVETRTESYYDAPTTDLFYSTIWGGSDIHIGLYINPDDSIVKASERIVAHMASLVQPITPKTRVLDLGAGYGGAARYLAKIHGCKVICVNLSKVQNERNSELSRSQGLEDLIEVHDGSFEHIPLQDHSVDVIWSQDSFLHSGDREKVISEISRVLVEKNGRVIFTDIMQSDTVDQSMLMPVLARLPVSDLGSPAFYTEAFGRQGLSADRGGFEDLTTHFVTHYRKVLEALCGTEGEKVREMGGEQWVERMRKGTGSWIDGGEKRSLGWGVLSFVR